MTTVNSKGFDWSQLDKDAISGNFINRGAYGTIHGPINCGSEQYALKRIMLMQGELKEKVKAEFDNKKDIWKSLDHKNLIRIHDVSLQPNALLIIMDYAAGGALYTILSTLSSKDKRLPLKVVSNWAQQIVEGMLYLHRRNIVHRDLKSGNIMVMECVDPDDLLAQVTLKIADFDEMKEIENTTTMSFKGTFAWMAPEVVEEEQFSKASDVFSFGVVLWELLTGSEPYKGEEVTLKKLMSRELILVLPETVPESYKQLFFACTNAEKDERPPFHVIEAWCHGNHKIILGERVYSRNPALMCIIKTRVSKEENVQIRAVTGLKDEFFVITQSSYEVEVYCLVKLVHRRVFCVNGLKNPLDMKSCLSTNCLIFLDCVSVGVPNIIIVTDVQGNVIKTWEVDDAEARLSVAISGNIIVSLVGHENKIVEYKCDGTKVRVIDLGFICPRHAMLQEDNKFLISHGRVYDEEDFLHRVFQLSVKDGETLIKVDENDQRIVKAYGGDRGAATGAMNVPWYMALDNNGYVFVADRGNERVVLLSPCLVFKRVLISANLRRPLNMWMDVASGRLFIIDLKVVDNKATDGRLLVFKVR